MALTFEAYRADGSPRRFAGMWRPPFDEVPQVYRPTYFPTIRESWLAGDFDRPLYDDAETAPSA